MTTPAAPPPAAQTREIWEYDGDGWTVVEAARPYMRVAFLPSDAETKKRRKLGHLIAAAPEMLAALNNLIERDDTDAKTVPDIPASDEWRAEAMRIARAAIAKARGNT